MEAIATLSPFQSDGTAMATSFQVHVPAQQLITLRDEQLGISASANGWLLLKSAAGSPLLACLTFGQPIYDRYESTLPLKAVGSREFTFGQVANGSVGSVNYWTGVAVLNSSNSSAQVTFRVCWSDGTLNGKEVSMKLAPGQKFVGLLSQIPGIGTLANQSSGYLSITATEPVMALQLFGDTTNNFLSAVPSQY